MQVRLLPQEPQVHQAMKLSHVATLIMTAVSAAASVIQQYAIGMPSWAHVILLAVFAVLTALGIPNLTGLTAGTTPVAPAAAVLPAAAAAPPIAAPPAV